MANQLFYLFTALVALSIVTSCRGDVNYTDIAQSDYAKDPLIPITQSFGIEKILNMSISTNRTSNTTFVVKKINDICNGTEGNHVVYKFDLSLVNSAGDVISANFSVQYGLISKKSFLLEWKYRVTYGKHKNHTSKPGKVNTTTVDNENSSTTVNNTESANCTNSTEVPSSDNNTNVIVPVNNTQSSDCTNSTDSNTPNNNTEVTVTVNITQPENCTNSTNETTPEDNVEVTVPVNTTQSENCTNSTNETTPEDNVEVTVPVNTTQPSNCTNSTDQTTAVNTTTPTATPTTANGSATQVPEADFDQTLYHSLAQFGTQYVAAKAVNQTNLPVGDYVLVDVYSISQQAVTPSVTKYMFSVEFAKTDGSRVVESNFTIQYVQKLETKAVVKYWYSVLPYGA